MVKIPTYEQETQAVSPISRNRPMVANVGGPEVYGELARFADTAGDVAAKVYQKHKAIGQDQELFDALEKMKKGDPENDIVGTNEMFTIASTSSDYQSALTTFDGNSKALMNTIADGIEDKEVKGKFLIKAGESLLSNYLQAERNIFVNARASYIETVGNQVKLSIDKWISSTDAMDTLGASQAHDEMFGKKDANGDIVHRSYGELLEARGMLPDGVTAAQFDNTTEEALENTYAAHLAINNPFEFMRLDQEGFFDKIETGKLIQLREKAKNEYTNLRINNLLTYYPVNGDSSVEDADALYTEAKNGNFGGNEPYQQIYNSLDQEGKNLFQDAIDQRHNQQKSEIRWNRDNALFQEQEANKENFEIAYSGILTGTTSIESINNQEWIGTEGARMKEQLVSFVVKRESGDLPTDGSLANYNVIFDKVVNKEITSLTVPFTLPGEKIEDAQSILQRTGGDGGLGTNQFSNLATLIGNRNQPDIVYREQEFSNFLDSYKEQIVGSPIFQKFNIKGDKRFFDFALIMRAAYNQGLAEGKSPAQLLLSTSPDFILKDLSAFVPSTDVLMKEMTESLTPTGTVSDEKQEWYLNAPQAPKDMTFEEFIQTDEYRTWKATEPD